MSSSVLKLVAAVLAALVVCSAASPLDCRELCAHEVAPLSCLAQCLSRQRREASTDCAPSQCRCKPGSSPSWSQDERGCSLCSCQPDGQAQVTGRPAATNAADVPAPDTTPDTTVVRQTLRDGCPEAAQCRCKPGASAVWSTDGAGCSVCSCVAGAASTAAPTRAATTTIATTTTTIATTTAARSTARQPTTTAGAPTTPASQCPEAACRCKPGAVASFFVDNSGCQACACVPEGSRAATTAAAATTTAAPARTTTAAPATTTGDAPLCSNSVCRCKPGAVVSWFVTDSGCKDCACVPAGSQPSAAATTVSAARTTTATLARGSTAAPITTTVAPAADQCSNHVCRCKPGAVVTYYTADNGCRECACVADPNAPTAATNDGTRPAPTGRVQPPATTDLPATRGDTRPPATTVAAGRCSNHVCRCKPGAVVTYYTADNGCRECACVADPNAPSTTTAAPTRSAITTVARDGETRAATTASPVTGRCSGHICRCKPGAVVTYYTADNGCRECACVVDPNAPSTTTTTAAATTTLAPTTSRSETRAATREVQPRSTTLNPTCPTPYVCRCKADAMVVWEKDTNGCPVCYCQRVTSTYAPARSSSTAPATSTARATTVAATTRTTTRTTARATARSPATCPPISACVCSTGRRYWQTDSQGCPVCACDSS